MKEKILGNVDGFLDRELADFINKGIVTWDELCKETGGQFSVARRKRVKKLLNHADEQTPLSSNPDDTEWSQVDKKNVDALCKFRERYPDSPHCREAKKLIDELEGEKFRTPNLDKVMKSIRNLKVGPLESEDHKLISYLTDLYAKKRITRKDILNMIRMDHNIFPVSVVISLLKKELITTDGLSEFIEEPFMERLHNVLMTGVDECGMEFSFPDNLEKISRKSTEVYFWGIPSSGKTCALGAILSEAYNGDVAQSMVRNTCQGYDYMTLLSGVFSQDEEVGGMPPGTPLLAFYEMSFDLEDEKSKIHPITCVDLAGELVDVMYKDFANKPLEPDQEAALNTMKNVLISNRSINRKIHFFVVEYGGHERKNDDGVTQADRLATALNYLDKLGVFQKDTDAIVVLVTKSDKVSVADVSTHVRGYLMDYYNGFTKEVRRICRNYEINNGKMIVIPFSLGEVCFQHYCKFDAVQAQKVVEILLERSMALSNGWWGKLKDILTDKKKDL